MGWKAADVDEISLRQSFLTRDANVGLFMTREDACLLWGWCIGLITVESEAIRHLLDVLWYPQHHQRHTVGESSLRSICQLIATEMLHHDLFLSKHKA